MVANLRVVDDPPVDIGDGDGDGDDELVSVEVLIVGADDRQHSCRTALFGDDVTADDIAETLLSDLRGVACAYSPDVLLALEHRLMAWGSAGS